MLIDNKDILIEEIKEDLRYCGFVKGSKISIDFETTKEIQNIVKLDEVLSYDVEYQRYELCTVSETYVKNVDKVYVINKNIISGENQKFYVKNFGWKKAKQLSFDDNIITNGGDLVISDIEIRYGDYVLYDLTIEKNHNFLVNGSLVHNQINISATPTTTITPTNTPTTTPTLTTTPNITPTTTITPSPTPTRTVTRTISITPSITSTIEPTPTITSTPTRTLTPTISVSNTPSISITPSITSTPSPTLTVTPSITSSVTISISPTISVTKTISPSATPNITPTITPTISITPTITPTIPTKTLFQDCSTSSTKIRFSSLNLTFNVNEVYEINGNGFNFFGKVITYAEQGSLYSSTGVSFIGPYVDCPTFCITNEYSTLSGFTGNYKPAGSFNSKIYYTGATFGVVYFKGTEWCLSQSLGGSCIITGKSPCFLEVPDFESSIIYSGYCVTPTPTKTTQANISFDANFSCEIAPTTTPSITRTVTPTNTVTLTPSVSTIYNNINLQLSAYTTNVTVTPSITPSITPTNEVQILGSVTFNMLENRFSRNGGFKVLRDCGSGEYKYTAQDLIFNGNPIQYGDVFKLISQGDIICVTYVRDDTSGFNNLFIDQILSIESSCDSCLIYPIPSVSFTPAPTITMTQTVTPTPSLSSNIVFVFESCGFITPSIKKTHLVQTYPYSSSINVGDVVKDFNLNCWVFLGYFSSNYISSGDFISLKYNGNYFNNYDSNIYINCQSCING